MSITCRLEQTPTAALNQRDFIRRRGTLDQLLCQEDAMWKEARLSQYSRPGNKEEKAAQRTPATGLDSIAVIARRDRGEEIHELERTEDYWYRVISGAAKCYVVMPGGRRQIVDLLLQNDFFCFTPCNGHYRALEAMVNGTVVACYSRRRAEALAASNPDVGREIRELTSVAVSRLQDQILMLGRLTAREKVGSFLLKMMDRSTMEHADQLSLVMSRYDIADYLAVSVETVSRSLTELRHRGLIALTGPRRVDIVDRNGLEDGDYSGDICAADRVHPAVNRMNAMRPV
jgi:CRP/FNR family nitrogen fixation transcriptional regulator